MEDTTYTLSIHHPSRFDYHVTIPEIGITTEPSATLNGAIVDATLTIEKHLTTRQLILVFVDEPSDLAEVLVDSGELESQAAFEVERLGIAPHAARRERHLVFELSQPLTPEQGRWLDNKIGKIFARYYFKDQIEMTLEGLAEG